MPMEPTEVPKSGNGAAIAAIVISLLAVAAVIVFAIMMQNSLNQINESIDEIEDTMETEVMDNEGVGEDAEDVDEEMNEIEEVGDGAEVYNVGKQRVDFLDYTVWVSEDWTLEDQGENVNFFDGEEMVLSLSCPALGFGLEGMGIAEDEERKIVSTGNAEVIARFTRYVSDSKDGNDLIIIRMLNVSDGVDSKTVNPFCLLVETQTTTNADRDTYYNIYKSIGRRFLSE